MVRLRRSDLTRPGISRGRRGEEWVFTAPDGRVITDPTTLERCLDLVLPPAWQDVWISPAPNGHVQAVGTDARGRRQYRYHDGWTARQAERKFDHSLEVAGRLPGVRERVAADLALPGMSRERALACAVRLLDLGFFRIGSEEYAESNGTFGLATIRREHVTVRGEADEGVVEFDYRAKSGKQRHQAVVDPAVLVCVRELLDRDDPGNPELLAWTDETGAWVDMKSGDINSHLAHLVPDVTVTAKDFRTWSATVLCAVGLAVSEGVADSATARKRAITRAVKETADYLGNTPTVCRASYIHPRLFDLYADGVTVAAELGALGDTGPGDLGWQGGVEAAVLDMLRDPQAARRRAHPPARRSRAAAAPVAA